MTSATPEISGSATSGSENADSAPSDFARFDFQQLQGVATELSPALKLWLNSSCSLFNENWRSMATQKTTLSHDSSRVLPFVEFKKDCAERSWGIHSQLRPAGFETALVLNRQFVLAIAANLLDEEIETDADSESLEITAVEDELVRMLAESILASLGNAWIGLDALDIRLTESAPFPRRSPLFIPQSSLVVIQFNLQLGESDFEFHWLLPEKELEQLVSSVETALPHPFKLPSHESHLQRLASGFEVGLEVQLGSTLLNVSQLQQLKVGDVITMNQSVDSPLKVSIGGVEKFEAIPGKQKDTQTIRIVRGVSTTSKRSN